jgi:ABC-type transporter Mla maintaining outer membrane lipid asymmetry ATPase subunit MlaF
LSGEPVIIFDKVSLYVEGRRFLDRADLVVSEGESLVVAGPPGCGKSFVLRLVLGLPGMARDSVRVEGDVIVDGHSIFAETLPAVQRLRSHMGSVLSGGGLIENMDVRKNITLPLNYHCRNIMGAGEIDARCDAILGDMGMEDLALPGRRPVSLNRMERMYVALARALVNQPDILLVDEPTMGISPAAAERLARFCFYYRPEFSSTPKAVEEVSSRPMTRVVTTVDLKRYLDFGLRFAVLVDGKIEELGDREAVLGSGDPKVRELLSRSADMAGPEMDGANPVPVPPNREGSRSERLHPGVARTLE